MTDFRRGREDDEDLVVLARQRSLNDREQLELEGKLETDPTLRIAYRVGRAFDEVAFVQPGDEALIARVVDQTLGRGTRRGVTRRWRVVAAVAAAFLFATGAATAYRAGIGPRLRRAPARDVAQPPPRAGTSARHATERPAAASPASPVPAEPGAGVEAGGLPRTSDDARSIARSAHPGRAGREPEERPSAPMPPVPAGGEGDLTASDLFRRAGAARRAGGLAEACALYRDLQARFPTAEEARLSHVSLGKLLLEMGRPQDAEQQFGIYLAGGAGALAAEAVFGRAQSFQRMGRSHEEREVWLGLVRDFPGSVYAGAARRRLAALDATSGGADIPGDSPVGAPARAR